MKTALITGASGFAGSFLLERLLESSDYKVVGTYNSESSLRNIKEKENVRLEKVDLTDKTAVTALIQSTKPDVIFHLAALTSPAESYKDPSATFHNNVVAQMHLLEAVKNEELLATKILIVSSGEIYGLVSASDLPIDEETPLYPTSPYSVSKIAQDYLGLQYFLSYKMPIIRARPFNHIGPRQSPNFVVAAFCKTIAEIEKNLRPPVIPVGNLTAKRDFTDVRDMVAAYISLIEKGRPGEVYNIGSGVSYTISDVLKRLLAMARMPIEVKEDETLLRPIDNPDLVCNNHKITSETGWHPTIALDTSLTDTLSYWRENVQ